MHATAATLLLLTGLTGPDPDAELLPAPKAVLRAEPPGPVLNFYRPNPYDVWQLYAVGQDGQFRARVIAQPEGAYYLYNGAGYFWMSVKQRNIVP